MTVVDPEFIATDLAGGHRDGLGHDSIDEDPTGYIDIASGFAAFVKAAVGDLDDAAGNVAAVAYTCARSRLFGTAYDENSEFIADPCSARHLWAGGLVLAAMSGTVGCRRVRDTCCCFVRDIVQLTPSAGHRTRSSYSCFRDNVPLRCRRTKGSFSINSSFLSIFLSL